MIRQVEYYHGALIARLIRSNADVGLNVRRHQSCRSAYVLDERVALYVKYATDRLSPWAFNFGREYQEEVAGLRAEFDETFITLVCGGDGVACLAGAEYDRLLDDDPKAGEWIKVARRAREKYSITGSDERRILKIADSEYPTKVLAVACGPSV